MAAEILAGLGAFKAMVELAKGFKDINDTATRNAVAIELQEKILAAQAEQSALVERIGELETLVAEFEAWDAEKERYKLKEIAAGQFAYVLKGNARGRETTHMLCANCYNHNQKAILQSETRMPGLHLVHFCQNCGSDLFSPNTGGRGPEHQLTIGRVGKSGVRARRGR